MKSRNDSLSARELGLLHYADDRLDVEDRSQVSRWLRETPHDAERVHDWRLHIESLRAHYDPIARAPVPEHLLRVAKRAARRSPLRYAAAIAWLTLGALFGYGVAQLHGTPAMTASAIASLPHDAAIAHATYVPEVRHPVEVGADQEAHLVAWLSKRLGKPLRIPQLGMMGFNLVGGRLLPSDSGPVAQFMYQNDSGARLTLYVSTETAEVHDTSFQFSQTGKVGVFYWLDHDLGYALSGEIERNTLLQVAQQVYRQLNPYEKQQ